MSSLTHTFVLDAAMMRLGEDDIKWELIKHLIPRFVKLEAQHEGLEVVVNKTFDRDFAIEELKNMTKEKLSLAAEVNRVMDELEGIK